MTRRTGGSVSTILGWAVAIIVVLLLGAEVATRIVVSREVSEQFTAQAAAENIEITDEPDISFGWTPVILSAVTRNVPSVEVAAPSTAAVVDGSAVGNPELTVSLTDLDISDTTRPVAGHLIVSTTVTDEYMAAIISDAQAQQAAQSAARGDWIGRLANSVIQVTDVRSDPARNLVAVEISNGAAEILIAAQAANDSVALDVVESKILGVGLPQAAVDAIGTTVRDELQDALQEFGGLRITDAEVVDGGLKVSLSGDNVDLTQFTTR